MAYDAVDVPSVSSSLHIGVLERLVGADIHLDQIWAARPAVAAQGSVTLVNVSQTIVLATLTSPAAPDVRRIWGFAASTHGTGEARAARFWLEIDGLEVGLAEEISATKTSIFRQLPVPLQLLPGIVVNLKCFNREANASFVGLLIGD